MLPFDQMPRLAVIRHEELVREAEADRLAAQLESPGASGWLSGWLRGLLRHRVVLLMVYPAVEAVEQVARRHELLAHQADQGGRGGA